MFAADIQYNTIMLLLVVVILGELGQGVNYLRLTHCWQAMRSYLPFIAHGVAFQLLISFVRCGHSQGSILSYLELILSSRHVVVPNIVFLKLIVIKW